ncbi:hypothetical protein NEOKW01_1764 [Nematocida sp. AWRm80]|nr:hypothetical protein NEOKW01_1764 [Nematocida sp. AWRm80]
MAFNALIKMLTICLPLLNTVLCVEKLVYEDSKEYRDTNVCITKRIVPVTIYITPQALEKYESIEYTVQEKIKMVALVVENALNSWAQKIHALRAIKFYLSFQYIPEGISLQGCPETIQEASLYLSTFFYRTKRKESFIILSHCPIEKIYNLTKDNVNHRYCLSQKIANASETMNMIYAYTQTHLLVSALGIALLRATGVSRVYNIEMQNKLMDLDSASGIRMSIPEDTARQILFEEY